MDVDRFAWNSDAIIVIHTFPTTFPCPFEKDNWLVVIIYCKVERFLLVSSTSDRKNAATPFPKHTQ